jgi:hypothetical protein
MADFIVVGNFPELLHAYETILAAREEPPGKDKASALRRAWDVLLAAMDQAVSRQPLQDSLGSQHFLELLNKSRLVSPEDEPGLSPAGSRDNVE